LTRSISVVIPTRNRRLLLRSCLESLARQTISSDEFEVIVVVDGSTDGTEEMLSELITRFSLTVVTQDHAGSSASRNAGAARARGHVLIFIDDDVVASPRLVAAHLSTHRATQGRIAGVGAIERRLLPGADRFARLRAEAARGHNERLARRRLTYLDCYGGNFSVSNSTFAELGGFAVDLPVENDFELAYRLDAAGTEFVFVPNAVVTEERHDDWREIIRDLQLRGRIAVDLAERHPAMLPMMELGGKDELPRRWVALRRLLLLLKGPPQALARLGFLLPRTSWARGWFAFVHNYSYWHGARSAIVEQRTARR